MSRPVFSFRPNMDNPEHKRAWEILIEIPKGQRNQYLVYVLLKAKDISGLENLIKETIRAELKDVTLLSKKEMEEEQIPEQMLGFLSELENT